MKRAHLRGITGYLVLTAATVIVLVGLVVWSSRTQDPMVYMALPVSTQPDVSGLRELQSSVDETRRLHSLILNAEGRGPPKLKDPICTVLEQATAEQLARGNSSFAVKNAEILHSKNSVLNTTSIIKDDNDGINLSKGTEIRHQNSGVRHLNSSVRHQNSSAIKNNMMDQRQSRSMRTVLTLTENCTRYVLEAGFLFARVSEEELSFPLAFSIIAYKDLEQVERLLRAVYRPHNVYCLHADRKSDEDFQSGLRLIVGCLPNVFMADVSVDVNWGTVSVLEPELECMRRLLAHRAKWRYFINLTGQEFPLKTNRELVQILTALRGANDITGTHHPIFHFRWTNSKPVPYNLTISKGDVHVLASREYVDYVINSRVAHELLKWLQDSFIPDESFFSTLNHNPQLGVPGSYLGPIEGVDKHTIRSYKIWDYNQPHPCAGKFVRNICQLGVGDLPRLTSSPFLVANKFHNDFQPLAYDCLEEWYFDKVRQENLGLAKPINVSLYENSDIVKLRYTGPVLIWE